jgi:hypothetical protein
MEIAAVIAIGITYPPQGNHGPPDYPDFVGIFLLLFVNATIGYIEDSSAADAVAALKAALAPQAKAFRDGKLQVRTPHSPFHIPERRTSTFLPLPSHATKQLRKQHHFFLFCMYLYLVL